MKGNLLFILSMIPALAFVVALTWNDIVWLRGLVIFYIFAGLFFAWIVLTLNELRISDEVRNGN